MTIKSNEVYPEKVRPKSNPCCEDDPEGLTNIPTKPDIEIGTSKLDPKTSIKTCPGRMTQEYLPEC